MKLSKDFNTVADPRIANGLPWEDLSEDVKNNAFLLAGNLQVIRDFLGKPVVISSGYRPLAKNASVGGSKTSQHLHGEAWDFTVKGLNPEGLDDLFYLLVNGKLKLPNACSQVIRETKQTRDGVKHWIHMGIKTFRWIETQKVIIADTKSNSIQKAKATARLTHCEFMRTPDTENFELIKRVPYGDFG